MVRSSSSSPVSAFRKSQARQLAAKAGKFEMESLERRQMLALAGVTLAQLPLGTYDATGVTTFDASTGDFNVVATPLTIRLSPTSGVRPVAAVHGDVSIRALIGPSGELLSGLAGDDLVIRGGFDFDGSGAIDPEEFGDLLTGEMYAFGFAETGATDRFDFKFVPTGGRLASYFPAGADIGLVMTAEASTFTGSFTESFTAGAKGNFGPIAAPALSSIAGTIYCDQDLSGSLTSGDKGLADIDVRLVGTDDAGRGVNLLVKTASDGSYAFTGLRPGKYYQVSETSPANTVEGANTVGTAGGEIFDEDTIGLIELGAGVAGTGYNFGYICLSDISGKKFLDLTGDGLSPDDTALAGTTIYIDANDNGSLDSGERSTVTGADGSYAFDQLLPGSYTIREVVPAGYQQTTPAEKYVVNVAPGSTTVDLNFANAIIRGSISGKKFLDVTGNGLTADDTPLGGTTIYIDANNNGSLDSGERSTVTASNGTYAFTGLLPGVYVIREIVQAGFQQTTPADRYTVVVTPGSSATNLNFANARIKGSISGKKFLDITGNGLTADDSPLGNVVVYLDANNNGQRDSGEASTTTGADGVYTFSNLSAGNYIVREVVPAGYVRTAPVLSDRYTVTLAAGQNVTNLNFANYDTCDCTAKNVTYSINGAKVVTDLRGNTNQGDVVTVTFTIAPGSGANHWTLVSYTAPGKSFVAEDAAEQRIYDVDTGYFGPGTYQLTVTIPDANYQIDFVCGLAIDQFGPAGSNIFYSAQRRLVSADNDGNAAALDNPASISGFVWLDDDNDGVKDANELPIQGAKITVSWTVNGSTKSISKYTDADGFYVLGNLAPGSYTVTEAQPSGYADGKDVRGSRGGTLANDKVSGIVLTAGVNATGYNFGERLSGDTIGSCDTAAVSFWASTAGGNLIRSLNGGSTAVQLGFWLANEFPALFGSGSMSLKGRTNAQIATELVARKNNSSLALETQVLAAALSAYVTNSAWAGGTMASSYGFTVNLAGAGLSTTSVGSLGGTLGFANNSQQRLLDILSSINAKASNGTIGGNSTARARLYQFFVTINSRGGID